MKRAVPSFTVEVRRRPRLATLNPNAQSSETKPPQGAFDPESHRASAAAFAVKKVDPSPTDVGSSPKGRILPSLVPDEPLRRPLRDVALTTAKSDPPSRAPKRPSARALKRLDQASNSLRNSGFPSAESAPLVVLRDESAISRDDARAKPLPNDQRSAIGRDFPATLPSRVEDHSPQSRKRTIMTRYVFGDELKPGERWKLRLLTTR